MDHIGLLVRLKLRLTVRAFQRDPWRVLSAAMIVLVILPITTLWGVILGVSSQILPPRLAAEMTHLTLAAVYSGWILLPLLAVGASEAYDLGKLFLYPVAPWRIAAAAILGSPLDPVAIIYLPVLCGPVVGLSVDWTAGLLVILTLLFFIVHVFAVGNILTIVLYAVLRSRRFRDVLGVIALVAACGVFLIEQMVVNEIGNADVSGVLMYGISQYLILLPSRLFSQALVSVSAGSYGAAAMWVAICGATSALTLALFAYVVAWVNRMGFGAIARGAPRARPRGRTGTAIAGVWRRCVSPEMDALLGREWRYLVRDPLLKMRVFAVVFALAVVLLIIAEAADAVLLDLTTVPTVVVVAAAMVVLLTSESQITFNVFASDAPGIGAILVSPCSAKRVILAKTVFYGVLMTVMNLAASFAIRSVVGPERTMQITAGLILGSIVFVACGNVISVYLPIRIGAKDGRFDAPSAWSGGCGRNVLYFALLSTVYVACVPIVLLLLAPGLMEGSFYRWAPIPVAAIYAIGLLWWSIRWGGRAFTARQPEIISVLAKRESM